VVLIDQRKAPLIELFEEFVPLNSLQFVVVRSWLARKFNAQKTYVTLTAGTLNAGRVSAAFFRPAPDLVMIGRGPG
jgi:hypothetical protein